MTLVILAAGMGSRYGGLKQLDPMTDSGEFIIDFSIYDAIGAGFDHVVFIIKEENLQLFRIPSDSSGKSCFPQAAKATSMPTGSSASTRSLLPTEKAIWA